MTLASGTKLGPYEILSPLGAGGMGEVYRARDPRLGREVAIKVLPPELAADRERVTRFDQEARSASALNHPNIVTIYEIGRAEDTTYIAMELVAGKTLREVFAEGPLPVRRLLGIAAQLADGLAAAHEAGIVHRDLKPENVMVTRDGHAKILDFGLAKLVPQSDSGSSQLATAIEATRPGVVLGTVGYMSPEQASGKPIDFRSDQFSLGSILYEMASGRRAFTRGTAAETLAAIIRDEPEELTSTAAATPAPLRWVIERCLAKDPHERYASTRDLARDLSHMRDRISDVSGQASAAPLAPPRRTSRLVPLLSAALVAAVALASFALLRRPHVQQAGAVRFAVAIPRGASPESGGSGIEATYAPPVETSRGISVSPDGTRIGIEATLDGKRRIFVRALDSEKAVEVEGSADATAHFWSPDSRYIAFFANGKLRKVAAAGGPAIDLCDAPFAFVGSWSKSGIILFIRLDSPGIFRVSDTGGEPVPVLRPGATTGETNLLWPYFLPDGRRFLYLTNPRSGAGSVRRELRLGSLESKDTRRIADLNSRVEYANGYLIYVRESRLFAQPFDEREARLSGEPRLLAPSVHYHYGPVHGAFSVSNTGVIAYQTAALPSRLVWIDRNGKELSQLGQASLIKGIRISPDGAHAAVDIGDLRTGTSDIWTFELGSGVATRMNSDSVDEIMPVWSADGSRLLYRSDRKGPPDIYQVTMGAPGSETVVLAAPGIQQPEDVSRDGHLLALLQEVQTSVWNIQLLPLEGDRKPSPWMPTRFSQTSPRFSPDGQWIAYQSDETGVAEVYAARTRGGADKRRISPAGGRQPRWRSDGRELYYVAPGSVLMGVPIMAGTAWSAAAPVPLLRLEEEIQNYDVAPDGSRFLVSLPLEKVRESPLRVILNWPELLKNEH